MGMWFRCLPALAIAAHLIEEFVWPGGFPTWYRKYPPGYSATVSTRFLVIINLAFVGLALLPPLLGPTRSGYAYWVVAALIAGANGIFHLAATVRWRQYSPGVVTGTLFYIPLAVLGTTELIRRGLVSPLTVFQAIVVAAGYSVWSSWRHRRHAVSSR